MRQRLVPDSLLITFCLNANRVCHVRLVFHKGIETRMSSDASEADQEECFAMRGRVLIPRAALPPYWSAGVALRGLHKPAARCMKHIHRRREGGPPPHIKRRRVTSVVPPQKPHSLSIQSAYNWVYMKHLPRRAAKLLSRRPKADNVTRTPGRANPTSERRQYLIYHEPCEPPKIQFCLWHTHVAVRSCLT